MRVEPFETVLRDEYTYHLSHGGQSHFFRQIAENQQFSATRCPSCNTVWIPTRLTCSRCFAPTEWVDLGKEGVIVTALWPAPTPPGFGEFEGKVGVALIQLDGANTCFKAVIVGESGQELAAGSRVKAVFKEHRVGSLLDFYFIPAAKADRQS